MTIWSAIESELPRLRAEAEAMMRETGKALRPTGTTYDPTADGGNGADFPSYDDLFGPVKCKVKPPRVATTQSEVGGRTSVTVPAEIHLPADPAYAGLVPGDVWEMVTVSPLSLSFVGRQYRITSEVDGTFVTACRYTVERVVS